MMGLHSGYSRLGFLLLTVDKDGARGAKQFEALGVTIIKLPPIQVISGPTSGPLPNSHSGLNYLKGGSSYDCGLNYVGSNKKQRTMGGEGEDCGIKVVAENTQCVKLPNSIGVKSLKWTFLDAEICQIRGRPTACLMVTLDNMHIGTDNDLIFDLLLADAADYVHAKSLKVGNGIELPLVFHHASDIGFTSLRKMEPGSTKRFYQYLMMVHEARYEYTSRTASLPFKYPKMFRKDGIVPSRGECVTAVLRKLLSSKENTDVEIYCNDDVLPIKAHSFLLQTLDYWKATLSFHEKSGSKIKCGICKKAMEVYLKYVYTGELDLTMDTFDDILKVSYQIPGLNTLCDRFLASNISEIDGIGTENFSDELPRFKRACLNQLIVSYPTMYVQRTFRELDPSVQELVVAIRTMGMDRSMWLDHKKQVDDVLNKVEDMESWLYQVL